MQLSRLFHSLSASMQEQEMNELLEMNETTKTYGLTLAPEDVKSMLEARNRALSGYGRVELGIEAAKELIELFSSSSLIRQEEYAETLNELQEVYYWLKNETEDRIGDRKLLSLMKEMFEDECEGALELLRSRLEEFAERFRRELQAGESVFEGGDDDWTPGI